MRKMKKGLAVLFAVLLLVPSISVTAEETVSTVPEEGTATAEGVSGGDVSENDVLGEEEMANEESSEEEMAEHEEEVDGYVLERAVYTAETQSGTLSGGLSWSFDGTDTLTLSGEGTFDGFSNLDTYALGVIKVVFSDCKVNGSMHDAFYGVGTHIVEIDCLGLDTSEVTDMSRMFYGSSVTSLDLSNFNTSNVTNMYAMFTGSNDLTSLDLSNFNTSNVTNMSQMFAGCDDLTSLDLSNFNTSNVTNMSFMFSNCKNLISLDLDDYDTLNVTDMSHMFNGCNNLTSLNLSNFNTSNVTNMSHMFNGCNNLTSLYLHSFDTSKVTKMDFMFSGCRSLGALDLSNFITSNVISMCGMFSGCGELTSLDLYSFDTSNVTNMAFMFCNITLTLLDLSSFDTSNVTDMGYMFNGCNNLTSLDLSNFDLSGLSININDNNCIFDACDNLKIIKTPSALPTGKVIMLSSSYYDVNVYSNSQELTITDMLDDSFANTTLKKYAEISDAVKYVIYSEMLPDAVLGQSYSVTLGRLPSGMELKADGELCGTPMETGGFIFGTAENIYVLTVLDNTDVNAESRTDSGYEIIQRIPNFTTDSITTNTIVSNGAYSEFTDVYIDGQKLVKDTDYTSEDGSTRVTIYAQTFSRFNQVGVHTITMEFRKTDASGGSELKHAIQNYYISAPGSNSEDSGGNSSSGSTSSGSTGSSGSTSSGSTGSSGSSSGSGSSSENELNVTGVGSTQEAEFIYYTVQPGDTIWKISEKFYGSGELWERIYLANTDVIQNPNRIYVGQVLKIYLSPDGSTITVPNGNDDGNGSVIYYTVASGDTLWEIAKKYYGNGRFWRRIYEANTAVISDPERLYAGWIIAVPSI